MSPSWGLHFVALLPETKPIEHTTLVSLDYLMQHGLWFNFAESLYIYLSAISELSWQNVSGRNCA